MLKLKQVAITGGLAAGKSTALKIFQELGAYTVSADQIVHQLLSQQTDIIQKVLSLLGKGILTNGSIDRNKVALIVFNSEAMLKKLTQILHPVVLEKIAQEKRKAETLSFSLFMAEIPLLFEIGQDSSYDETIAILCSERKALERFQKKTGKSQEDFYKISKLQLSPEEKARRATHVIHNNSSEEDLRTECTKLYSKLTEGTGQALSF